MLNVLALCMIGFARGLATSFIKSIKTGEYLWLKTTLLHPLLRYGLLKHPVITLPSNIKIYVNNADTVGINIPDMFERREYSLHRSFIPRRGRLL